MSNGELDIADILLTKLAESKKPLKIGVLLLEKKLSGFKKQSIRVAISRLRRKGDLTKTSRGWAATRKGEEKIKMRKLREHLPSPFSKTLSKNTIVAFDVPVRKNRLRDWLRDQLKIFHYEMIQQSLWFGPGPLPVEFLRRLEGLNIRKNIKILSVKKLK